MNEEIWPNFQGRHRYTYEEKRDKYPRNNRAECMCWQNPDNALAILNPCAKSELYYGKHKREVTSE